MKTSHVYTNPKKYSVSNNLQFSFAMQLIAKANIDKNDKLLDLGCGDGKITAELAKIANSVVGTDISETMVEHANDVYASYQNLYFLQMDASKNIFKNQFTVITSFNCLHWVKDQENALKGIALAAMKNAKIILLLSHKKSTYHFALDITSSSSKWKHYFKNYINPRSFFECEKYYNLLIKAGLEVSCISEKELTYHYESLEEFKAFLSSSMANIKQIPDDKKMEFLNDYCDEFFKLLKTKDYTHIPVSFWCLEVFANKLDLKKSITASVEPNKAIIRANL